MNGPHHSARVYSDLLRERRLGIDGLIPLTDLYVENCRLVRENMLS
jgi:hypothetical protein